MTIRSLVIITIVLILSSLSPNVIAQEESPVILERGGGMKKVDISQTGGANTVEVLFLSTETGWVIEPDDMGIIILKISQENWHQHPLILVELGTEKEMKVKCWSADLCSVFAGNSEFADYKIKSPVIEMVKEGKNKLLSISFDKALKTGAYFFTFSQEEDNLFIDFRLEIY